MNIFALYCNTQILLAFYLCKIGAEAKEVPNDQNTTIENDRL